MELNCVEKHVKERIEKEFKGRNMIIGRVAHLTEPLNGRGKCRFRNRCDRGCPYGAYFSSNAVTLPAAHATGNMTIRPFSIVQSIVYDEQKGKASGVRIIDSETGEEIVYKAKIVFVNASTLSTTQILLNSTSNRFPNGLGNDSGELGHNLMDHTYRIGAMGTVEGFDDQYYKDAVQTEYISHAMSIWMKIPSRTSLFEVLDFKAVEVAQVGEQALIRKVLEETSRMD